LARRLLGLSITDQFSGYAGDRYGEVAEIFQGLRDAYERAYYTGLLYERRAKVQLHSGYSAHILLPLIEDAMEGVRKFVAWIMANHPDAHGEIKRVFADGDYVILHSHWHGLSDNPRGEAVVDMPKKDMR